MRTPIIILLAACLVMSWATVALGLGMEYQSNEPIIQQPSWPQGLADLLMSRQRVYAYFVNSSDFFYYQGDTQAFNDFLARYAQIQGPCAILTVQSGRSTTGSFDVCGRTDIPFDWRVRVEPFADTHAHFQDQTTPLAVLEVWTGGSVKWSSVNVPKGMHVFDMRSFYDEAVAQGAFAIYLLRDKSITTRTAQDLKLDDLMLDDKPLLTMDDIVRYEWTTHTIVMKPEVSERIPKPVVMGTPFVVMVEGKRIYLGSFYTACSSWLPSVPYATVDDGDRNKLVISRGLVREGAPDPRTSPAIMKAFGNAGKLSEAMGHRVQN